MPIPFATTTVTIIRPNLDTATRTAYDPLPVKTGTAVIASNVRAVISTPSMDTQMGGGNRVVWNAQLVCDLVTLQSEDTVTDAEGNAWKCLNVWRHDSFGPHHLVANLRRVTGAV